MKTHKVYDYTGTLRVESEIDDQGRREGLTTVWYGPQQKRDETAFINNEPHGKSEAWYPNGQLEWRVCWHRGKKHGECCIWGEDGALEYHEYFWYGQEISKEEYGKNRIIEKIVGLSEE